MSRPFASPPSGGGIVESPDSVVPTLRVMRLQSPILNMVVDGATPSLHQALCLPDSLQVLVGETFTAYLGVLNVSRSVMLRRLSVSAHLQTPSQRWPLPSPLENNNGVDVPVGSAVDAIVSHVIEEEGQHILRVEVSYASPLGDGGLKTFRKFYRFQVSNPLVIRTKAVRAGDGVCFVSVWVEYNMKEEDGPFLISSADFVPAAGLCAERLGLSSPLSCDDSSITATQLLDESGIIAPGSVQKFLFQVSLLPVSGDKTQQSGAKGLVVSDKLGTALFTWRKSMGETGRISSSPILVPEVLSRFASDNNFVVHRSGWSADVAAAANRGLPIPYLVTVEPLNPPCRMILNQPELVEFHVINHSENSMSLQLQFRLSNMRELVVCGPSFVSLGQIEGRGGSTVVQIKFLPLATGLLTAQGCWVVDLASDREIAQPALFEVYVEKQDELAFVDKLPIP